MNSGKTIFAQPMDFIPSDYEFHRLEREAREQRRGLWGKTS